VRSREIARRYAEAVYSVAAEEKKTDALQDELGRVNTLMEEIPDFRRLFQHPLASKEQKLDLLEAAFPDLSGTLHNALRVLVHNRREAYLDLILEEFLAVRAEAEGVVRVRVVTAKPLSLEEKGRLADRLERALGRRVTLDEVVEPGLLAGVRIETEGKVFDGTLRARLDGLQQVLER
jgi:F-type H+-transporting ATPase subunit delta